MTQKKLQVGDVRKKLLTLGFDVSEERIRHYEKLGLYKSRRNQKNDYREYSEDNLQNIVKLIILIELGTPIQVLLDDDKALIKQRIETIKRALNILLPQPTQ